MIEILLSPAEQPSLEHRDLSQSVCVVFDVLRATSVMVTALQHGATAIVPVCEIGEALEVRSRQPDVLLAGERDGLRIPAAMTGGVAFEFGNSPREYTADRVRNRTIVSTTTNGTRALRFCRGAQAVLAASLLNLTATAQAVEAMKAEKIVIVCAGTFAEAALEDMLAAGALTEKLCQAGLGGELSDSAWLARQVYREVEGDLASAVKQAKNARKLLANPDLRDDVAFCLALDRFGLVARMDCEGIVRRAN